MTTRPETSTRPAEPRRAAETPSEAPASSGLGLGAVAVPVAFATTVTMWAVGYVAHLEALRVPRLALIVLIAVHLRGAWAAARRSARPRAAGLLTGFLVSLLNLLILASFLTEGGEQPPGTVAASVGGFLLAGTALGFLMGILAGRHPDRLPFHPERVFTRVAACATFLLVIIGGIVTTHEAGLAVPDWPTSFEANMFLLPFSRMVSQSDVYYEHAHRLFGALVGLTTVTLALFLARREPRRWVKGLGGVAALLVVAQGTMGGLRVSLADNIETLESAGSLALRVAHGVTGQVFLALLVALATFYSAAWTSGDRAVPERRRTERTLTAALLALVLGQLLLGALTRHLIRADWVLPHILGAIVVGGVAVWTAARAVGIYEDLPAVRGSGLALVFLVILQLFLGFFALAFPQNPAPSSGTSGSLESLVTTGHQATGALVLSVVVVHLLRVWRLVGEPAPEAPAA